MISKLSFVLVALVLGARPARTACTQWTAESYALAGSKEADQILDHYYTSSSQRHTGEDCVWDITCPLGSFLGFSDLDFMVEANEVVEFVDADDNAGLITLDTWSDALSWVTAGSGRANLKGLYPTTNKLRVTYNTTSSGTVGYGFRLTYKCYTTTCPTDLVPFKTSSTAAQTSFEVHSPPVFGVFCDFYFACSNTADTPWLTYTRGSAANPVVVTVTGSNPVSTYTVPSSSGTGMQTLSASASHSISYTMAGTPSATTDSNTVGVNSNQYFTVWTGCQASTQTTCNNVIRNGATLDSGYGIIASDPEGEAILSAQASIVGPTTNCEFHISCPSPASSIIFTGAINSHTFGELYVRASAGVGICSSGTCTSGVINSWISSVPSSYTFTGNSAYVYLAATGTGSSQALTGAYVIYSCGYPTCSTAHSGLHLKTKILTSTTMAADTVIPMTDEQQDFMSDLDGAGTSEQLSNSSTGEMCSFSVMCPKGYYVMLNVTGRLVNNNAGIDRIYGTGTGNVYDFSMNATAAGYGVIDGAYSVITDSNSMSWTQSAFVHSSGFGYTVKAGCTSFVAGTCPLSTTHFSSLSSASLSTSVTLDTYVVSSADPTVPAGYKCDFPITCPSNGQIEVTQSSGLLDLGSNPNRPVFKTTSGSSISWSSSTATVNLGRQSAVLTWETTQWNVTNSYYNRGFKMTVKCVSTGSTPSTPSPPSSPGSTPSPGSPSSPSTPTPATPAPTVNPNCPEFSGLQAQTGSTSSTTLLSHWQTSSSKRHTGNKCIWDITCPSGSMLGFTDLDFMMYNNDALRFDDTDTSTKWVHLDTWAPSGLSWLGSGVTKYNYKGLYPNTRKMRVTYNTSSSGSTGWGFRLTFKCFTSTCPSDLVTVTTTNSSAESSFSIASFPVIGTSCTFDFKCYTSSDKPWLAYTRGSNANSAVVTVNGSSLSYSNYTVPTSGGSGRKVLTASSNGYKVYYKVDGNMSYPKGTTYSTTTTSSSQYFAVWAGCQTSGESTCMNMKRDGATLSLKAGESGLISSDPEGNYSSGSSRAVLYGRVSCEFKISCSSSQSIKFVGAISSYSYGALYIRSSSGGSYVKRFTSSSAVTYTRSSSTAYVYIAATSTSMSLVGAWVNYTCMSAAASTPSPATPNPPSAPSSYQSCHYDQTTWALTTSSPRHRFTIDMDTTRYRQCTFTFTCPTGSYGIAFKSTMKYPSSGTYLGVTVGGYSVPSSGSHDLVINTRKAAQIVARGKDGTAAIQASCLTTKLVPYNSGDVNVRNQATYSSLLTERKITTYLSTYTKYTPSNRRRAAYANNEDRAFLISCQTTDQANYNYMVSISSIKGTVGSGDKLTVHNLDSGKSSTFSGTVSKSYQASSSNTLFHVSSQHYVTWESDSSTDSSATGIVVYYYCTSKGSFSNSGIGSNFQAAKGDGWSSGSEGRSMVTITLVSVLVVLASLVM